jgi:F420H(2)-dependent quinone reductase
MDKPTHSDPAEKNWVMRLLYRDWRPTLLGRWMNRLNCWWSGLGLPPKIQAALEVKGRMSGQKRMLPVVIATLKGERYLVSMLGAQSDWVKNVEAAHGRAVIRQGARYPVRLELVSCDQRAPILQEYVRIARSGRRHFPLAPGAPLAEFEAIAGHYPVYKINRG